MYTSWSATAVIRCGTLRMHRAETYSLSCLQKSRVPILLLCADDGPLLTDSQVQAVLGSNMLPVFRLLHAQVAAAAAVLAKNIRAATGHLPVSSLTKGSAPPMCTQHAFITACLHTTCLHSSILAPSMLARRCLLSRQYACMGVTANQEPLETVFLTLCLTGKFEISIPKALKQWL